MIKDSFGLSEKGSVRHENQDSYLLDKQNSWFAVADGLGGLPNGSRASKLALEILHHKLLEANGTPLSRILAEVNEETRNVGYQLNGSGFGTTLTMLRVLPDSDEAELAHIGDSAAYLVRKNQVSLLTEEHTLAARMVADEWSDADDAIPLSAHHTLTQCIGQELYVDPQVMTFSVQKGDRIFLLTDGVTKPMSESELNDGLLINDSLERICQALTFRIEIAGSPDNYTIVALEF